VVRVSDGVIGSTEKGEPTMEVATGSAVIRAMERGAKILREAKDGQVAHSSSAGFIVESGGKRKFQVFVEVAEYSDDLFKKDPDSGGLLKYAGKRGRPAKKEAV
jgi:hypothetical protein